MRMCCPSSLSTGDAYDVVVRASGDAPSGFPCMVHNCTNPKLMWLSNAHVPTPASYHLHCHTSLATNTMRARRRTANNGRVTAHTFCGGMRPLGPRTQHKHTHAMHVCCVCVALPNHARCSQQPSNMHMLEQVCVTHLLPRCTINRVFSHFTYVLNSYPCCMRWLKQRAA